MKDIRKQHLPLFVQASSSACKVDPHFFFIAAVTVLCPDDHGKTVVSLINLLNIHIGLRSDIFVFPVNHLQDFPLTQDICEIFQFFFGNVIKLFLSQTDMNLGILFLFFIPGTG